jgi:glycosyltransferase involved in cell wall biosynthesis
LIDILISALSDEASLGNCINSIDSTLPVKIHVLTQAENPRLQDNPGSTFNNILQYCTNPIFTIIDSNDYFLPGALQGLIDFIKYKSFGLLYATSLHRITGSRDEVTDLPLTDETVFNINPMRSPIFYNRKVYDYLQRFDNSTYYPEYDMCLKIWQRFECHYYPTPLTNKAFRILYNSEYLSDLETLVYNAKVRASKNYYYAYPAMYPHGLLDPICTE